MLKIFIIHLEYVGAKYLKPILTIFTISSEHHGMKYFNPHPVPPPEDGWEGT